MEEGFDFELRRAPDDAKVNSPEFQGELAGFSSKLRAAGIDYHQRAMALDSADAVGYALPAFAVAATPTAVALIGLAKEWVKARAGRKIKVKIGEVSIEACTVEEIEKLLPQILDARPPKPKKK